MADHETKTIIVGQLSETELEYVRQMIEDQKRMRWLISGLRTTASWIAIVIGAVFLLWDRTVIIVRGIWH